MKLYEFDPRTLALIREFDGEPMPGNPDMTIVPENATPIAPPEENENATLHFDKVSSVWFYRPVWRAPAQEPISQAQIDAQRADQVRMQLAAIDAQSVRPARAVALALASLEAPDELDVEKLLDLEEEAAALRFELHTLTNE